MQHSLPAEALIGRDPEANLRLVDPRAHRFHAAIFPSSVGLRVRVIDAATLAVRDAGAPAGQPPRLVTDCTLSVGQEWLFEAGDPVRIVELFRPGRFADPTLPITRWAVETDAVRVDRGGSALELRSNAAQVLRRLLASPGQPVPEEEVIDPIWPDARTALTIGGPESRRTYTQGLAVCLVGLRRRLREHGLGDRVRFEGGKLTLVWTAEDILESRPA